MYLEDIFSLPANLAGVPGLERPLRVHVHIDTGLGREGFTLEQLPRDAAEAFPDSTLMVIYLPDEGDPLSPDRAFRLMRCTR